jgi:pyrophosphatase PpaX
VAVVTPRWKVALFDLDGTLVDTIALIVASHAHALDAVLGVTKPEAALRRWIGLSLADTYEAAYPDHAAELEAAYRAFNQAQAPAMTRPFPGMVDLLSDLRAAGVRAGVATSKRRPASLASLAQVGLGELVEVAATAEDTARHKPDPAPLLAAARYLGTAPAAMVYVGDAVYDARAARAAGMDCVLVTYGAGEAGELAAEAPTALVADTAGLRAVLLGAG